MTAEDIDLLEPIAAILKGSKANTETKIRVLIDVAAGLLAMDPQSRSPAALQKTADEARDRIVTITKATHEWIDGKVATAPRRPATADQ